jgi:hypothetical protein
MIALAHRILWVTVAISLAACTSLQTVPVTGAANGDATGQARVPARQLVAGASVRVHTRAGPMVELVVTATDDDGLRGTSQGQAIRIAWADIASLEERRFDLGRTLLLVVLGVVALGQLARGVAKTVNTPPP